MNHTLIWIISFLAIAGVIIRPFKVTEAVYAITGAILLLLFQLVTVKEAFYGVSKGLDVYLFLTGMMLLAETAREEKLFDWLAAHATLMAKGSSGKLFLLIYLVGVIVTTFLSNDAAAVVLTPAVAAVVKASKVEKPLPYLLICAFIVNAASFVLPISNPANLVIYGSHMPPLLHWLGQYLIPSVCTVTVTYFMLRFTQRSCFKDQIKTDIELPDRRKNGINRYRSNSNHPAGFFSFRYTAWLTNRYRRYIDLRHCAHNGKKEPVNYYSRGILGSTSIGCGIICNRRGFE